MCELTTRKGSITHEPRSPTKIFPQRLRAMFRSKNISNFQIDETPAPHYSCSKINGWLTALHAFQRCRAAAIPRCAFFALTPRETPFFTPANALPSPGPIPPLISQITAMSSTIPLAGILRQELVDLTYASAINAGPLALHAPRPR